MRVYYYENELEDEFNAFDSFAIQLAFKQAKLKKKKMYRVIREGNYTGFPGILRSVNAPLQHTAVKL